MATITKIKQPILHLTLTHHVSKKEKIEVLLIDVEQEDLSDEQNRIIAEAKELLLSYGDFEDLDEESLDGISLILTGVLCDVVEPLKHQSLQTSMEALIRDYLPKDASLEEYKGNHLAISKNLLGGIAKVERVVSAVREQLYVAASKMESSLQTTFTNSKEALIDQDKKRQDRMHTMQVGVDSLTAQVSSLFHGVEQAVEGLSLAQSGVRNIRQTTLNRVGDALELMRKSK